MKLHRQMVLAGLTLFGLGIWDFATRVYVPRASDSSRSVEAAALVPVPAERSADTIAADLSSWMPGLGASTDIAGGRTPVGQLALVAVFREGSRAFALLGPASLESASSKLIRISVGDSVQGLRVVDVGRDRVRLVGEDGTAQDLFMFKSPENAIKDDASLTSAVKQAPEAPVPTLTEVGEAAVRGEVRPPWLPPGVEAQTPRQLSPEEDRALRNTLQMSPATPVKR